MILLGVVSLVKHCSHGRATILEADLIELCTAGSRLITSGLAGALLNASGNLEPGDARGKLYTAR
jgi:hypothetical protein